MPNDTKTAPKGFQYVTVDGAPFPVMVTDAEAAALQSIADDKARALALKSHPASLLLTGLYGSGQGRDSTEATYGRGGAILTATPDAREITLRFVDSLSDALASESEADNVRAGIMLANLSSRLYAAGKAANGGVPAIDPDNKRQAEFLA